MLVITPALFATLELPEVNILEADGTASQEQKGSVFGADMMKMESVLETRTVTARTVCDLRILKRSDYHTVLVPEWKFGSWILFE